MLDESQKNSKEICSAGIVAWDGREIKRRVTHLYAILTVVAVE
jgi:hypothetical protein